MVSFLCLRYPVLHNVKKQCLLPLPEGQLCFSPVIMNTFCEHFCLFCVACENNLGKHNVINIILVHIFRLHKRDSGMSLLPQQRCNEVLIKFMQMVVSFQGRCIDVYHYEYEIVNCGFWNFRRHFEHAIYLMTKFILIELCWALRMTKPAGQSGKLSLGKRSCSDICLNTALLLVFPGLILQMLFGATKGMVL